MPDSNPTPSSIYRTGKLPVIDPQNDPTLAKDRSP